MARKGGVPADRVLNSMDLTAISEWLLLRKRSSAQATSLVKSWRKSLGAGRGKYVREHGADRLPNRRA